MLTPASPNPDGARDHFRKPQPNHQRRNCKDQSGQRSSYCHVEQGSPIRGERLDFYECAEGSQRKRDRDEERRSDPDAVGFGGEIMSQFVGAKDEQQTQAVRQTHGESLRLLQQVHSGVQRASPGGGRQRGDEQQPV